MNNKEKHDMVNRLSYFVNKGVSLYIDGHISTPEEIADMYYVNEECIYMPDYIMTDCGELTEVRFDKVVSS